MSLSTDWDVNAITGNPGVAVGDHLQLLGGTSGTVTITNKTPAVVWGTYNDLLMTAQRSLPPPMPGTLTLSGSQLKWDETGINGSSWTAEEGGGGHGYGHGHGHGKPDKPPKP